LNADALGYIEDVRFFLIPVLAALSFGRSPAKSDVIDLNQAVKLESPIPCDGSTNPQQEIILDAHFSPSGWLRSFVIDNYQDESCRADIAMKCLKHVPAGWRDDLRVDSEGTTHYWLNSCRTWGSKDAAQYTLSGWYKEGAANNKKLPWKQVPVRQVSTQPEVYEVTDPNGGTGRVEIKRR
jgi:hypothetical protein